MTVAWRTAFEAGGSITGWGTPTGTLNRSGFATFVAPTINVSYAPARLQIQAMANALQTLSEVVAALITDVRSPS
jgi:hypothetical protein